MERDIFHIAVRKQSDGPDEFYDLGTLSNLPEEAKRKYESDYPTINKTWPLVRIARVKLIEE